LCENYRGGEIHFMFQHGSTLAKGLVWHYGRLVQSQETGSECGLLPRRRLAFLMLH
jgi:hypothetical protein